MYCKYKNTHYKEYVDEDDYLDEFKKVTRKYKFLIACETDDTELLEKSLKEYMDTNGDLTSIKNIDKFKARLKDYPRAIFVKDYLEKRINDYLEKTVKTSQDYIIWKIFKDINLIKQHLGI